MPINKTEGFRSRINKLIATGRIKEAMGAIRARATAQTDFRVMEQLETLRSTYESMLHYFLEGSADAGRAKMLNDISGELTDLCQTLLRSADKQSNPDLYFNTLRSAEYSKRRLRPLVDDYHSKEGMASLGCEAGHFDESLIREKENILSDIFNLLWVSYPLAGDDRELVGSVLTNPSEPFELSAQAVSALLLGGTKYFDVKVFEMFVGAYLADSTPMEVKARLLIAILLLGAMHSQRIGISERAMSALGALVESEDFGSRTRDCIMAIIATRETKKLADKMRNEIIPGLQRLQPGIMKRFKDSTDPESFDPEMNPEWEDLLEKSGMAEHIREMTESQMRGADVMMPAFANLKNFPFFQNISSWFLPFSINHSELKNTRELAATAAGVVLGNSDLMCDSDRFSFAFSLERMPESQKQMLLSQFQAQAEQLKEEMTGNMVSHSDFRKEATRYVRNLYRFFCLFRSSNEFANPFTRSFPYESIPATGKRITADHDTMHTIAEEYFRQGLYADAVTAYRLLPGFDTDNEALQKAGFCYQNSDRLADALEMYTRAEFFDPESKWLVRKLATVNRLLGNFKEAIGYYKRALEQNPDNKGLLMNLGHCYTEIGEISEALKAYYKVSYLNPEHINSRRAIAWCRLLGKEYDKARTAYEEILTTEPSATDYLNMGHLALIENRLREANAMYRQSIRDREEGFEDFLKDFAGDRYLLESHGVNPEILPLMLDTLRG